MLVDSPSRGPHGTTSENPAVRLVLGSPILTRIKYCEGIFDRPKKPEKPRKMLPESPLFIPKRANKDFSSPETLDISYTDSEPTHEPYRTGGKSHRNYREHQLIGSRGDPYENVVITSRPYTCTGHSGAQSQFYQYEPREISGPPYQPRKGKRASPYDNMEHVTFQTQPVGYYPQRQYVRYQPQRAAPTPPTGYQLSPGNPTAHGNRGNPMSPNSGYPGMGQPTRFEGAVPVVPARGVSPGQDTNTSGYSSYDQTTLSLQRAGPTSPLPLQRTGLTSPLPTTHEEACSLLPNIPGIQSSFTGVHSNQPGVHSNQPATLTSHALHPTLASTFDRTAIHQKFLLDQTVLRQYFCVALTTCILCPPCGFWSLFQAFKVDDMVDRANYLGAERLAKKVRKYSLIMLGVGLLWVGLTVAAFLLLLDKFGG